MLPCWKFGTTGTALAADPRRLSHITGINLLIIIYHLYRIVISETNCPVADVPAPPAVSAIAPEVAIVPAKLPTVPPALDVWFEYAATDPVVGAAATLSPNPIDCVYDYELP